MIDLNFLHLPVTPHHNWSPVQATNPLKIQAITTPKGSPSVHLDALRGIAALGVLLAHWRGHLLRVPIHTHGGFLLKALYVVGSIGHQWVIVFFAMSGYLVGGSVLRSATSGRWSWRSYLFARMTRLYMVLLPALLLGGLLDLYSTHLVGKADFYTAVDLLHEDPPPDDSLPTLIGNTLFLQTIKPPLMGGAFVQSFGSNQPLWSLCNEFWYYMAFPLLVLLFAKGRSWPTRAACVLGFAVLGWFVGARIALLGIPWLMGAFITYLPPFPAHHKVLRTLALIVAPLLTAAGIVLCGRSPILIYGDLILGVIVTFLLWVTLTCATAPLPSIYVKLSTRMARSSYTLYLTHFPFLIFLKIVLALPLFVVPNWHLFFLRLGFLPVIIIYSQLIYELFEKRTDQVRKWLKPFVMGSKKLVVAPN